MKRQAFHLLPVALLSLAAAFGSTGCGDSEHHDDGHMAMESTDHHHNAMMPEDHLAHTTAVAHSHAEAGHMQHMSEVREWLKEELKERYDQPVPPVDEAVLKQGREIYRNVCSSCHGLEGYGDGPGSAGLMQKPADFTDAAHATYYSDQARLYIIRNGVPGTPMTAWDDLLSEAEIQAVFAYVRSLRSTEADADQQ